MTHVIRLKVIKLLNTTRQSDPVNWDCKIYQLHLYRGVRPPPNECPDMTLNNLMVKLL